MADNIISKAVGKASELTEKISGFSSEVWGMMKKNYRKNLKKSERIN